MIVDQTLYGVDLFGEPLARKSVGIIADKFLVPPFTVLDAKTGEWQARKRAWISAGIQGEVGRSAKSYNIHDWISEKDVVGCKAPGDGTSIFDPVLCEIMYRWFCPPSGQILDPFAGGSVRGIVASILGMDYWGCDLRAEQIAANEEQAARICTTNTPHWIVGDSMTELDSAPSADFVFSCPPYGDLEKYSDDPADLSNMEFHTFIAAYKRIILRAVTRLKHDRFACFVVGDFRDNRGYYRNFVSETIRAFQDCGARLYNDAVLLTSVGSASMRVSKQFDAGRKMCKTHQNVLVFCKGDWRKAAQNITQVKETA
jgi:DNA modification methylase